MAKPTEFQCRVCKINLQNGAERCPQCDSNFKIYELLNQFNDSRVVYKTESKKDRIKDLVQSVVLSLLTLLVIFSSIAIYKILSNFYQIEQTLSVLTQNINQLKRLERLEVVTTPQFLSRIDKVIIEKANLHDEKLTQLNTMLESSFEELNTQNQEILNLCTKKIKIKTKKTKTKKQIFPM